MRVRRAGGWRPGGVARAFATVLWAVVVAAGGARAAAGPGAWIAEDRPTDQAREALALLDTAASHGLDPADYAVEPLRQALASGRPIADPVRREQLEASLDAAFARFLHHLHFGRVDPASVHQRYRPVRREPWDANAVLAAARDAGRLAEAVADAVPRVPLYGQLREALAAYRALGSPAAWQSRLPPLPAPARRGAPATLEAGMDWPGLPRLAERLVLLGDLPAAALAVPPATRYEGAVVDAVRRFQRRHGLGDDGIVGAATRDRLEVAPAARARQIELTLERLRWTPVARAPRMVTVNIPEFVLRAYEVRDDGRFVLRERMRVIVGKALDTRTPLFDEDMSSIEFSPYWNVPPSIARSELVPRLRRDPGYLRRQDFEIVGADGGLHDSVSPGLLDAVLAGQARLRQRPGEKNALGDIKFVFPNRDHIYLHHTPSTGLFARDRRDFSHGCIRLEEPLALARFVLEGMPGWDEARIREAMARGQSSTVRLARPLPVLIGYGTVLAGDGSIRFFDDLYGLDRVLDEALQRRAALSSPPRR